MITEKSHLSAESIAARAGCITATRAAMILEESLFGGPQRAQAEILGVETGKVSAIADLGNYLQPSVAAIHRDRHGVTLVDAGTIPHPSLSWLAASPDYFAVSARGEREYVLECKTADDSQRKLWGLTGTAQVPPGYRVQVAVQLACSELPFAVIALLIGGNDYREYRIERDLAFERDLLDTLGAWYKAHIVEGLPVPGSKRLATEIVYQSDDGEMVDCSDDPEVSVLASELKRVRGEERALEAERDALEGEIIARIGPAKGLVTSEGPVTFAYRAGSLRADAKALVRLARELGATQADIDACYERAKGGRTLRVPSGWTKGGADGEAN